MNFKSTKKIIKDIFLSLGVSLIPRNQTYDHSRSRVIESHKIDEVLDIGANVGQYAKTLRKYGYRGSIISFEPLPDAYNEMASHFSNDHYWRGINIACGASSRSSIMNVSQDSVCSSLSEPTSDFVSSIPTARTIETVQVGVQTLDEILGENFGSEKSVLLKIDVQGYERNVLAGAKKILSKCSLLEIELSISGTYVDALTVSQAIPYFDELGFRLVSIGRGYSDPTSGMLLDADFLFERKINSL